MSEALLPHQQHVRLQGGGGGAGMKRIADDLDEMKSGLW